MGARRRAAKLPDNLTTFKVMAVAVTAGDRYGKGESSILVTRPLVARAALPRFVRPGDAFTAGAVINARSGGTPTVRIDASGTGVELRGDKSKSATLEAGRGREVRFSFRATPADTAVFRFGVASGKDADAVQTKVPVRAEYLPHYLTVAGVLRDSGVAEMTLPAGIDAARSRVTFSLGASPTAVLRGLADGLRVYPYECTEQVTSAALPLLALLNAKSDTTLARATHAARRRARRGGDQRAPASRRRDRALARARLDVTVAFGIRGELSRRCETRGRRGRRLRASRGSATI